MNLPQGFQLIEDNQSALPDGFQVVDEAQPSFMDRLQSDWQKRKQTALDTPQSVQPLGLSDAQAQIGLYSDVLNEGLKTAGDFIGQHISPSEKQLNSNLANYVVNTPNPIMGGQSLGDMAGLVNKGYHAVVDPHPMLKSNIEMGGNAANVLSTVLPLKPAIGAAEEIVGGFGSGLKSAGQMAVDSAKADRASFLQKLITPKETPTVKNEMFANSTESGLLRSAKYNPTQKEISTVGTLSEVPVKSTNSLLKNYNIIEDAKNKEAESLKGFLSNNDVAIPDDTIINTLSDIRTNLGKNPYISTSDGLAASDRVINGALEVIQKNPLTASGILQARKDFDQWVNALKGEKGFNPALDSPVSNAIREVRQGMNGMIADAVPDAGVRTSLGKQSDMYHALDAIETKGGSQGKNMVSRAIQTATDSIPGNTIPWKIAAAATGLGTAVASPALAATAGLAYGAYKGATSQPVKKLIGGVLSGTGESLQKMSTKQFRLLSKEDQLKYFKGKK